MYGMYWVRGNLPRLRSALSSVNLVVLCKTIHINEGGNSKVLKPMRSLEILGI